jgi:hypothetical protein
MSAPQKQVSMENFMRMVQGAKKTNLPLGASSLPLRVVKPAGPPKKTLSKRKNRRVNRKAERKTRRRRRA